MTNAGRSQLAAGWLHHLASDLVRVLSAGVQPATEVNPLVVEVMAEVGVDLSELRGCLGHAVVRFTALGVDVSDRERGHSRRRAQIALHQRGGERLRVGDVVESGADRVGREQGGGIDVEREQILDRARVLGPRQALKRTPARVGRGPGGLIEAGLERRGQRGERGRVGTPCTRRRHHAGAQLADHALGDVGVPGGVCRLEQRE